jgi:hypothetical protein
MYRRFIPLFALAVALPATLAAQAAAPADSAAVTARIQNALSAAPPAVAAHATVADMDGTVLRAGTNGWVCLPDMANVPNNAPMCLDAPWRELIDAWQHHRTPKLTAIGVGYMLQGDLPVSNTDPFAQAPTADNHWIQHGPPHIMLIVPDARLLETVSTDPANGGPWVMWKGTPYAHIMIPTVARTD